MKKLKKRPRLNKGLQSHRQIEIEEKTEEEINKLMQTHVSYIYYKTLIIFKGHKMIGQKIQCRAKDEVISN
jgi:hypothetical protein